jgi:hypothetical protein
MGADPPKPRKWTEQATLLDHHVRHFYRASTNARAQLSTLLYRPFSD